jgi:hypothetical protein
VRSEGEVMAQHHPSPSTSFPRKATATGLNTREAAFAKAAGLSSLEHIHKNEKTKKIAHANIVRGPSSPVSQAFRCCTAAAGLEEEGMREEGLRPVRIRSLRW